MPDDLGELRAREIRAIGKVTVPRTLERCHHELSRLLAQEARRREKFAASDGSWDKPRFGSPVDQRRLQILNALFLALARRGHSASIYERDGVIDAAAIVGDTRVRLEVDLAGQHRDRPGTSRVPTSADLPAKTPLALTVDRGGDGRQGTTWQDDAAGTLESKLAEVAAGVVVAGEAAFRRGLKSAEEQAEKSRAWEERQRRERADARDRERLTKLRESGELLRQAGVCTGIQRGTPPRASQLIDWAQQGETGTVQIGVARNPPLEHAFGLLLKHFAYNNRGSRVERRSTCRFRHGFP